MNEFERRKAEVGPADGKDPTQAKLDTVYILGANPNHSDGRIGLLRLADDPDPEVSAAALRQLYPDDDDDDSSCE